MKDRSSRQTRVREIMSGRVITVTPQDTVERCMWLTAEYRIRHLPVLDGERVVGIISVRDLVNWIIHAEEEDRPVGRLHRGKVPGVRGILNSCPYRLKQLATMRRAGLNLVCIEPF